MERDGIDIEKIKNHWIARSESDFETMENLMISKDFHWALFLGHLVIERLLKALIVTKTGAHAPLTHDLRRLARTAGLNPTDEQNNWLDTITTFNINARYDDYKKDFYKKCTEDFASIWIKNIHQLRTWIKTML